MTNESPFHPSVETLVDAIMQSHGQLTLILDHMERNRNTAPDADPIPVVLHRVLCDVLSELPDRHDAEDLATAAQMLAAATDTVADNLFLVDTTRGERRAARRRRGMH